VDTFDKRGQLIHPMNVPNEQAT